MHFHYIWRWKLYGCIRGAPDGATVAARWRRAWCQRWQCRRRDVVTSASFTSKDWITKLEMDSVSIHQRRRAARHGGARCTVVHQFTNWLMNFLSLPSEHWAWLIRSHFSIHHEICKILPIKKMFSRAKTYLCRPCKSSSCTIIKLQPWTVIKWFDLGGTAARRNSHITPNGLGTIHHYLKTSQELFQAPGNRTIPVPLASLLL